MQRKFRITVDGRAYDVVVEEITGEASTLPPASFHLANMADATAASAAPAHSKPAAGAGDEVAPLAGVVTTIDVTIGETVTAGAKIATIEAMKMKTEVYAKGAGKVVSIAVKPGESVDTGAILLTLA
jgi:biotin carboxyl carrier protein